MLSMIREHLGSSDADGWMPEDSVGAVGAGQLIVDLRNLRSCAPWTFLVANTEDGYDLVARVG